MATRDLYIDTDREESVASADDQTIATLPKFTQGDSLPLRVWLLVGFDRLGSSAFIPVEGITLQVALGTKVGNVATIFTQQYTWTASDDLGQPYFEAVLPMATEEIDELLGESGSVKAWFEVKMVESGLPRTILSKEVTIYAAVIKPDTAEVAAGLTPLSAEAANATYLQRDIVGPIRIFHVNGKGVELFVDEFGVLQNTQIN